MKSKIAFAKITQKNLFYEGSITIDESIMKQANIRVNEKVQVVNVNNGERLETYVIKGEPGSNIFGLNGPAARKGEIGDELCIISYAWVDPEREEIEPVLINLKVHD